MLESRGLEVTVNGIEIRADQPPESRAIHFDASKTKEELALPNLVSRVRNRVKINTFKDNILKGVGDLWHVLSKIEVTGAAPP